MKTAAPPEAPTTVVLVVIDGARWQEIFLGTDRAQLDAHGLDPKTYAATADSLFPYLSELARRGASLGAPGHGAPFLASGPNFVSLPGYTEVLTGHPATCQENDCEPPGQTIFDVFGDARVTVLFVSWDRLGFFAPHLSSGVVVSAGRLAPPPSALVASTDPTLASLAIAAQSEPAGLGGAEYRTDVHTSALGLAYFEREHPAFMFVSLGDTDELAHDGDYAGYLEALRRADTFAGDLMSLASKAGSHTAIFVTADHGRADDFRDHGRAYPESSRSFLIAGGAGIPARGWVACPESRRLADVAPTIAALVGATFEPDGESHGAPIPELTR